MISLMPRMYQTLHQLWHCSAFQFSDTTRFAGIMHQSALFFKGVQPLDFPGLLVIEIVVSGAGDFNNRCHRALEPLTAEHSPGLTKHRCCIDSTCATS